VGGDHPSNHIKSKKLSRTVADLVYGRLTSGHRSSREGQKVCMVIFAHVVVGSLEPAHGQTGVVRALRKRKKNGRRSEFASFVSLVPSKS